MSDPFDIPPPRKPTISEIIQDNITDLYDRDAGVKQADNEVLDAVIDHLLSDRDKADYFFQAVVMYGDSADFVDQVMDIARDQNHTEFAIELQRNLRRMAQSELDAREDEIIHQYDMAEQSLKTYDHEVYELDDYRSKKGD